MKSAIIGLLLILLLLGACSVRKHNQSATMLPNYGILKLVGETDGRQVFLEGQAVKLDPERGENIFQLAAGTYQLEIRHQEQTVYKQRIVITSQQTNTILIP